MSEKTESTLCLIGIAILIAVAQTMDFNDQQAEASATQAVYVAWHQEVAR